MNIQDKILKRQCEGSFEFFVKYMYKEYHGRPFMVKDFHIKMFDFLNRVYKNELNKGIIEIPPRHGKTELMILFDAWIFAKNPKAKTLVLSYSGKRAEKNAEAIRNYILHPAFQKLWDIKLKSDNQGKGNWVTTQEGEVFSASSGGQITGFGAGSHGQGCESGLIIIDDPLKPEDSNHENARNGVNNNFTQTILSRKNGNKIPIILIMQRLHEDDLAGFLTNGGDGDEWEKLTIPVYDEDKKVIFPEAFSQDQAEALERSNPWIFAGQYLQEPAPLEGGIWKKDWFINNTVKDEEVPDGVRYRLFVDGAYTENTKNDPTGLMVVGMHRVGRKKEMYIKHNEAKYMELPRAIKRIKALVDIYNIEMVMVENQASGKSLVQMLKEQGVNARTIKSRWARKSKIDKANDLAPYAEAGKIKIIKGDWNEAYIHQVCTFPNAKHDEDVDNTAYAGEHYLLKRQAKVL